MITDFIVLVGEDNEGWCSSFCDWEDTMQEVVMGLDRYPKVRVKHGAYTYIIQREESKRKEDTECRM